MNPLYSNLPRSLQEQYALQDEILQGKYGVPGDTFMTTRKLAELKEISLVTAHNILSNLCNEGYLELRGKKYYMAHSKISQDFNDRSRLIGLIMPEFNNSFYSSLCDAVVRLAKKNNYRILAMATYYSSEEERRIYELMINYPVVGIINCTKPSKVNLTLYQNSTVPLLFLSHALDNSKKSSVQINSFSASQKVAAHLIEQGYKKFLYIGTDKLPLDTDIRYTAFKLELNKQGHDAQSFSAIQFPQAEKSGRELLSAYLEQFDEPIGVFCYHDLIAAQLYRVCYKLGKKIPYDVGVVGFDDLPIATSLYPPLTTVHYRASTMAQTALQLLFENIENASVSYDNYYIEPILAIRKSTLLSKD